MLTDAVSSAIANELTDLRPHTIRRPTICPGASLAAVAAVVNGRYSEVPIKQGR